MTRYGRVAAVCGSAVAALALLMAGAPLFGAPGGLGGFGGYHPPSFALPNTRPLPMPSVRPAVKGALIWPRTVPAPVLRLPLRRPVLVLPAPPRVPTPFVPLAPRRPRF